MTFNGQTDSNIWQYCFYITITIIIIHNVQHYIASFIVHCHVGTLFSNVKITNNAQVANYQRTSRYRNNEFIDFLFFFWTPCISSIVLRFKTNILSSKNWISHKLFLLLLVTFTYLLFTKINQFSSLHINRSQIFLNI